jgi:hypothetical protein
MPEEAEPGILRAPFYVDAVQLIALTPDGSGKASVEIQKRTIGAHKGVPIVVAPANDLLGISIHEGVEDPLSAHEATGLGAWASGGASFLPLSLTQFQATWRQSLSLPTATRPDASAPASLRAASPQKGSKFFCTAARDGRARHQ